MGKVFFVSMVCLLASGAVAGQTKPQPLNIKPGLWEIKETYAVTGGPAGMPATPRTISYKNCVTSKDLATNPFGDPKEKCSWSVVNSTGTDMEVRGTSCEIDREQGIAANVVLNLHVVDSEHVNGSGGWTANGNGLSMSGKATGSGKWIAATCSAE